ncbi:hypothetical protein BVRB_2g026710 [Beta vulgaris subsp. vulgaris]|nr:hypothetical protein BVRB_2g026710 [Beta vulgaris subsp. vulgaris]
MKHAIRFDHLLQLLFTTRAHTNWNLRLDYLSIKDLHNFL